MRQNAHNPRWDHLELRAGESLSNFTRLASDLNLSSLTSLSDHYLHPLIISAESHSFCETRIFLGETGHDTA